MHRSPALLILAMLLNSANLSAQALEQCSACHRRTDDTSAGPPALESLSDREITEALDAFSKGLRPGTTMQRIARGLTLDTTPTAP